MGLDTLQAATSAGPLCPVCKQPVHHGKRKPSDGGDGPLICAMHGEVGRHNHDSGEDKMYSEDAIKIAHAARGGGGNKP